MAFRKSSLRSSFGMSMRQMARVEANKIQQNRSIRMMREAMTVAHASDKAKESITTDWQILGITLDGSQSIIFTFPKFAGHIREWTGRDIKQPAFEVLPGLDFICSLIEMLNQNTVIYTTKASYRLIKN